jgi:cephalosporin hydroxylase
MMHFNLDTVYGIPMNRTGHFGIHYREINTVKCPFDYVLYQMIIMDVKPDLIIEIGSYKGGSALYYADLLQLLNNGGQVHTIDIVENIDSELVLNNPNIKVFSEGYQNYDINLTNGFNKILVIDDGSHQYQDVVNAFDKFSNLVSKDSYYIIEDGVVTYLGIDGNFGGGPLKAIDEIISQSKDYVIDRKYCDFFGPNATFNPNGYLKKIH